MNATKKLVLTLARDTYVFGIHGITGQQIDEGYLAAGTPIKNIRVWEDAPADRETAYRFEACTDGAGWYTQETYGKPVTV